jgi:glycosyltransferase involved in cell wall biosynthesis
MAIVDIVVPVHGALRSFRTCIESVLQSRSRTPYELIVVDDGNTDPDLLRYLHELKSRRRATIVTQATTQGYAAAVNRASSCCSRMRRLPTTGSIDWWRTQRRPASA